MSSWVGNPGRPPYVIPRGSAGLRKNTKELKLTSKCHKYFPCFKRPGTSVYIFNSVRAQKLCLHLGIKTSKFESNFENCFFLSLTEFDGLILNAQINFEYDCDPRANQFYHLHVPLASICFKQMLAQLTFAQILCCKDCCWFCRHFLFAHFVIALTFFQQLYDTIIMYTAIFSWNLLPQIVTKL